MNVENRASWGDGWKRKVLECCAAEFGEQVTCRSYTIRMIQLDLEVDRVDRVVDGSE